MNTSETFSLLFNKNQNTAYKALKILQKESEHTDHVYPFWIQCSIAVSPIFGQEL